MQFQQDIRKGLPKQCSAEVRQKHPAQMIQELKYYADEEMRLRNCSKMYGSGLAMQLAAERHIHGQPLRLPGLKSSYLGLEIAMNRLGTLEFDDFIGTDSFILPKKSIHDLILEKL